MCITLPGRVVQRDGPLALVECDGQQRWCNALVCPEVAVGDYVETHANLILTVISPDDARAIIEAAREWDLLLAAATNEGDHQP
jgi:hydrogenase assembly chaperone HypC/HupF